LARWCVDLPGDPAWWQALAGILQAAFAIAIFVVTRRYVKLTGDLVTLQGEVIALQRQTAQRELYDRRVKVYDTTRTFMAKFSRDVKIEFRDIQELLRDTREAEFLFEKDATGFIDELWHKANEHRVRSTQSPLGLEALEEWLMVTSYQDAKRIFGRYLKIAEDIGPQ